MVQAISNAGIYDIKWKYNSHRMVIFEELDSVSIAKKISLFSNFSAMSNNDKNSTSSLKFGIKTPSHIHQISKITFRIH